MKTYPELEKMGAVSEKSQAQGAFLDWLIHEKEIVLCAHNDYTDEDDEYPQEFVPIYVNIEELLAEYHGIDLARVERERRELLADFVAQNE